MIEYTHFECPDCQFTSVLVGDRTGCHDICPLCAIDCGHEIIMRTREALPTDEVEGNDARLKANDLT